MLMTIRQMKIQPFKLLLVCLLYRMDLFIYVNLNNCALNNVLRKYIIVKCVVKPMFYMKRLGLKIRRYT